jgi:hypothetical protein
VRLWQKLKGKLVGCLLALIQRKNLIYLFYMRQPMYFEETLLDTAIAPDFTLADFQGQPVRLADYRGRRHVVLVYNRGFT